MFVLKVRINLIYFKILINTKMCFVHGFKKIKINKHAF